MSRAYDDNQTLQQKIMAGANKLADNVASTLGPRGRNVLLQEKGQNPFITKDGVTVAAFVKCEDPFENAAAQVIKQAAIETNNEAGDGTTTATVLAQAIVREGHKAVAAGMNPMDVKRGVDMATASVVEELNKLSKKVNDPSEVAQVGTISANGEKEIGELISNAMEKVGKEGVITVEEAKSLETTLDVVEGMQFDRGYLSPYFVTNAEKMIAELEDPYILIHEQKLTSLQPMLPILEKVVHC